MSIGSWLSFASSEIGLKTLFHSSWDVYIIIALRMIRLIGFGSTSLILALYLKTLGIDESYIGFFMTLTFVGDLTTSFLLSLVTDQIGRKRVLVLCSVLMLATGVVFATIDNYYLLLVTAVVGILTPSGGEVGPFRTIEQSSIASLCNQTERSDVYAWYTFLGSFCAAFGSFVAGSIIDITRSKWGFNEIDSYKSVFGLYCILSLIGVVLSLFISGDIEAKKQSVGPRPAIDQESPAEGVSEACETTQLLPNEESKPRSSFFNILPHLSPDVYLIVLKISLLFGLDSFASSLTPLSWTSFYIKRKFGIPSSYLGSVFFITGFISGVTSLGSTSMTKRLGPVVTMVATHLPASILLAVLPFPNSFVVTLVILVLRASMQTMDVAPKHVFLAATVPDDDRTAVFGFVNVVKTLAQIVGPSIVGILTENGLQWVTFVVGGSLKVVYDLGVLVTFLTFNKNAAY
ncbi:predicted membrane transporter [Candida orthopsilosis Co 90-125]|uniref:Predicted membrane transporter n=1 Tax=Candida orthopsilosis (strain 90-125) TaxID=1136231 RepID=H8WWY9_CANO9|nr:predicted membrane transporter [Candida orthopsilosis Co 90-125]CCG21129.1 predicted membrane transporter [Candida orthopsilosis Co 90-125]